MFRSRKVIKRVFEAYFDSKVSKKSNVKVLKTLRKSSKCLITNKIQTWYRAISLSLTIHYSLLHSKYATSKQNNIMMFHYLIFNVLTEINYYELDEFFRHFQICKININNKRLFSNNDEMYCNIATIMR